MKGYFHLKPHPIDPEVFTFGNLGAKGEPDLYQVGSGRMVAHDLLEHNLKHKTAYWTTYEEEYRALGACAFIRSDVDISVDIDHLMGAEKEIKPFHQKLPVFWEDDDLPPEIVSQVNAGYWQKHHYWKGDDYRARRAFEFIERETDALFEWAEPYYKYSIYFDTDKQIFRPKEKSLGEW